MPLISVIIPVYNVEPNWLKAAIISVLNQSYDDIEIIVVDDSSDLRFSGLDRVILDKRIIWVLNHKNLGVSAARNIGVQSAHGDWIAFLDGDDWWSTEKLKMQVDTILLTKTVWNYTSAVLCDQYGKQLSIINANVTGDAYKHLLKGQAITGSCSGVIVNRDAFIKAGMFEENSDLVEDWDMWLRLAKLYPVSCVTKPLVYLRTGVASRSSLLQQKIDRVQKFHDKYHADYVEANLLDYSKAHYYYVSARQHFVAGNWLISIKYLILCLIKSPFYFIGKNPVSIINKLFYLCKIKSQKKQVN